MIWEGGLLYEVCLLSLTSVKILCASLMAGFGHMWLVDCNKHMGGKAETAQILKPYATAWETMSY